MKTLKIVLMNATSTTALIFRKKRRFLVIEVQNRSSWKRQVAPTRKKIGWIQPDQQPERKNNRSKNITDF